MSHLNGTLLEQERNCREEAARISRGDATALSDLKAADFDALIVPGGFGAAKNLCNHAHKGDAPELVVDGEVERVLKEFSAAKKPIGLCCIAPVLAAKVLGATVTVGRANKPGVDGDKWPYAGTADAIAACTC